MSRVGKKPISVPDGVAVTVEGSYVKVQGPRGELTQSFPKDIAISRNDGTLTVSRPTDSHLHRSLHGLSRSLLANMVEGVSNGFQKSLEIVGVGYRAQKQGENLVLQVGYSHPVAVKAPPGISLVMDGPSRISVQGIDKQLVGEIAAKIRDIRPSEPYQGKGIRYVGEIIRRKAGKAGKAGGKRR